MRPLGERQHSENLQIIPASEFNLTHCRNESNYSREEWKVVNKDLRCMQMSCFWKMVFSIAETEIRL